jgi:hypothetical protein
MDRLWPLLTISLFLFGALLGVVVKDVVQPPPPPNPYGTLPQVGEPPASAQLTSILIRDDARALADYLDPELMQPLAQALQPLEEVFMAHFVGAVEKDGTTLAGYVLTGRVGGIGTEGFTVGIVFSVLDGQIVGVN